jgi:hypothetical protein
MSTPNVQWILTNSVCFRCKQQKTEAHNMKIIDNLMETNRTETNFFFVPFLFSEMFCNRKLELDPRGIVRTSSLRGIQCLK